MNTTNTLTLGERCVLANAVGFLGTLTRLLSDEDGEALHRQRAALAETTAQVAKNIRSVAGMDDPDYPNANDRLAAA